MAIITNAQQARESLARYYGDRWPLVSRLYMSYYGRDDYPEVMFRVPLITPIPGEIRDTTHVFLRFRKFIGDFSLEYSPTLDSRGRVIGRFHAKPTEEFVHEFLDRMSVIPARDWQLRLLIVRNQIRDWWYHARVFGKLKFIWNIQRQIRDRWHQLRCYRDPHPVMNMINEYYGDDLVLMLILNQGWHLGPSSAGVDKWQMFITHPQPDSPPWVIKVYKYHGSGTYPYITIKAHRALSNHDGRSDGDTHELNAVQSRRQLYRFLRSLEKWRCPELNN